MRKTLYLLLACTLTLVYNQKMQAQVSYFQYYKSTTIFKFSTSIGTINARARCSPGKHYSFGTKSSG